MSWSNSRCTTVRATSMPCCKYTAPISASVVSARMLDLLRPPVQGLAPAQQDITQAIDG